MKEKIIEMLKEWLQAEDATIFTDDIAINQFAKDVEPIVNQEVEKRIAERMPSPSDKLKGLREYQFNVRGRHEKDYITEDFLEGVDWLRSRLTNDNQKKECDYYASKGKCLPGCMTDSCIHHPNNR